MSGVSIFLATVGMGIIVLLCRASFMLPKEDLPMPNWLREGLRYAPMAALAAIVAPELFMTQGHLIDTWRDARIFGAAAGMAYFAWRRDLFGTIICGCAVMLVLRAGFGW